MGKVLSGLNYTFRPAISHSPASGNCILPNARHTKCMRLLLGLATHLLLALLDPLRPPRSEGHPRPLRREQPISTRRLRMSLIWSLSLVSESLDRLRAHADSVACRRRRLPHLPICLGHACAEHETGRDPNSRWSSVIAQFARNRRELATRYDSWQNMSTPYARGTPGRM